ncbi:hypothetical protein P7K49_034442 [Saguinus oedipus]|uniref:Uncharacterized protein n=1 Tax=Saguinus oedipus TaxID=9490 RepID=A0ABQ9TUS0_SAGOE|nr:hypothetical protein P7K49_034442 [Saguinus oedipus]
MPSPWEPPPLPPRELPGWGRAASKPPADPAGPRAATALRALGHLPPTSLRGSARQRGPRPGAGGTPRPGHPPALSRPWGRPRPGAEERIAEEQPEAPESETSRRRSRPRHCGEEGEEEREEGRADFSVAAGSQRHGDLLVRRYPVRRQDLGTLDRLPSPPGTLAPSLPPTRRPSGAPIPDQPSGAADRASSKDFSPDLGRTPLHAAFISGLSPESPRILHPFSSRRRISLRPATDPLFKTTHLLVPDLAHLGYLHSIHPGQSLPSTTAL